MRRLLADLSTTPAVVLGRRTDILAWNPMAAALFNDFARILDRSFLAGTDDPDQRLITLTAEPGTPSHDRLRILASWTARAAGHPSGDR